VAESSAQQLQEFLLKFYKKYSNHSPRSLIDSLLKEYSPPILAVRDNDSERVKTINLA